MGRAPAAPPPFYLRAQPPCSPFTWGHPLTPAHTSTSVKNHGAMAWPQLARSHLTRASAWRVAGLLSKSEFESGLKGLRLGLSSEQIKYLGNKYNKYNDDINYEVNLCFVV